MAIVLGLTLLLCSTAVWAASPAHPVGSDGGREAPASGDPLVVPPGDWGAAPPVNPPALRPEPPAAAAPAGPAPSRMPLVLALLAVSLVVAFSRRRFDWPGSRPAPPPALPPAPPALPPAPPAPPALPPAPPAPPALPPAPRRVQLEVPLVFAPPQKPTVSTRKITVQVPQPVTRLQQVLRTRTVPVMRVVQRIEYVPVTETTYTTVTEPVYKTRRRWVPAYEIYRGKPRQVGGYLEDEEVQVGTRTRRVPQTVTRLVAKKITDRVPGVDTITETVTVPVTTTEFVTREQTVTVEDPPDPVVIARVKAAAQGYQAAAERWWQALAAGDAAGLSAAAQQLRALSPQVGREFAADLQRRLEAQHAAAVQGLVQRQRARYWQSVAGGDEAGRQQAEQSLAAVHTALGSGILDGAGDRVRAAVASAEAAAAAAGRPLARQAALDAVREQWRQVDAHNLAGAQAAARRLVQIGQAEPAALAAAEQAERALGRDLRAEAEAALLQAKQGWWQGLCEASAAAVAGSEVTARGWRDLCAARGVAVRQDGAAVDAQGRQQAFAAVQAAYAQVAGGARGEPARRWAYYLEHRGWWLAGHEAEFLAPLRERTVALGEQWWQTLTDGGAAVSERAARLQDLAASAATLRALAGALGLGELPKADEAALRQRAVQYASDLAQRLAAARSDTVASRIQAELGFLSEQGIKPAVVDSKPLISEEPFDPQWPVQRKIDYWKPHAMEAQEKTGIPWQVILAQFGLESGYGKFVPPGSNNAFGITADDETDPSKYVEADTVEGSGSARRRKFRKYSSFAESFEDHNDVLLHGRYSLAMNYRADPYQYLAMIWVGNVTEGYATDPYYLEKVGAIIYRLETGKEATVEYRTDNNSKLGGAITHVIPTGDFLNTLRDRVYSNPKVKEAMIKRHRRLHVQSQRQPVLSWDYPNKVFMGGEWGDVTN